MSAYVSLLPIGNISTETALLHVRNDILLNMNKQHVTLLVFLDLSTAFNMVDHDVLLGRLEQVQHLWRRPGLV